MVPGPEGCRVFPTRRQSWDGLGRILPRLFAEATNVRAWASGCVRCQRDAAPDAQRAWRAPCLTRPGQVTMRAVVNVLARASLELNYPFWMGDRRVGTWWTCEVIPDATNETHGRAGVISGTVDRAIRIRRPDLSLLPFLPSIRDVEKVPPMRDVADD